jgi:predicted enzyme related to lactoylglutathione lyase
MKMKLNHINLVVSNVKEATHFFEQNFNFKCTEVKGDYIISILKGIDDFTLVIMAQKEGLASYPDAFHIGFMLNTENEVVEKYEALKKNGMEVGQEPRKIRDSFGFYFTFDTLMIEVGT